jgi:hypothetical protein
MEIGAFFISTKGGTMNHTEIITRLARKCPPEDVYAITMDTILGKSWGQA